jgi:hypothetical protein
MARQLSIERNGCAVGGGLGLGFLARLVSAAPALVVALVTAMAAIGGAFIGHPGALWAPTWQTIADEAMSHPSADRVGPGQNDPARGDHANDDGYVEGLARALGYDSVEQMARASRPQAPANWVHR